MKIISGKTFANAYGKACKLLVNNPGFITNPRSKEIKELTNVLFRVENPYSNLFKNKVRDLPLGYLKDELNLYFSGRNDAEGFSKASKFWNSIKNNDNTVNSAYGYLIFKKKNSHGFTQWQWAYNKLKEDKDTRQAFIFVSKPSVQYKGVKDFICTTSYHFLIRENKLHLTVNRRSQDIFFGLTYDYPWESLLMQQMLTHLNPSIYDNLKMGTYTLHCTSLHLYQKNYNIVENMIKYPFKAAETPRIQHPLIYVTGERMPTYNKNDEFIEWLYENE